MLLNIQQKRLNSNVVFLVTFLLTRNRHYLGLLGRIVMLSALLAGGLAGLVWLQQHYNWW